LQPEPAAVGGTLRRSRQQLQRRRRRRLPLSLMFESYRRFLAAAIVSALLGSAWIAAAPCAAAEPLASGARPVADLLDRDGSLELTTGYSGALDITGFRMTTGTDGAPRFIRDSQTPAARVIAAESPTADDLWEA